MSQFESVKKSYTYNEFIQLMELLVAEGKTTGIEQPGYLIFFTKLNLSRYQRLDKTFVLSQPINANNIVSQTWWVLNESWCGDAAQCLPVLQKIAEASDNKIEMKIILRDENPAIMDQYLTNGIARSIPKLISVDNEGNELFTWGPRPAPAQQMMMEWKTNPNGKTLDQAEKELHTWYAKDRGLTTEAEMLALLKAVPASAG